MPGSLIYEGPSMLDAQPIFVAAVWSSSNRKTGDMVQTYIMRSDINPLDASKYGEDYSICGDCKLRGEPTLNPKRKQAKRRPCYVNLGQGPLIVWRQYEKGAYRHCTSLEELGMHQQVRLGTYGDPAAVPAHVWERLISKAKGWTGYSHQMGHATAAFKPWMTMVSADDLPAAQHAWSKGYRTFRIVSHTSELIKGKEVLCPASKEAGHKATCSTCMLCAGSQQAARSIAIVAHGNGAGFI
jgi:hypothetical protein